MFNFSGIRRSIELPIGARLYLRGTLLEVVESKNGMAWDCSKCAFYKNEEKEICHVMKCNDCRHDKKFIFFKEIEETKEENNG